MHTLASIWFPCLEDSFVYNPIIVKRGSQILPRHKKAERLPFSLLIEHMVPSLGVVKSLCYVTLHVSSFPQINCRFSRAWAEVDSSFLP